MWKDKIQRLFRYRKITPSPALWEQLEAQLTAHEAQQAHRKYRKVWYIAAAASVLLCLTVGYVLQQDTPAVNNELQLKEFVITPKTPIAPTAPVEAIVDNYQKTQKTPVAPETTTTPNLLDLSEVDTLFTQYTADAIQARITQQMQDQMVADLQQLSPEDLALVATTKAQLNQYVAEKYEQDKTFSTIERELLINRVKVLAGKLLKEVETRVALNNKN